MENFIDLETQKLNKLKMVIIAFLLLINFSILGFFIYASYRNYIGRNMQNSSYMAYALPTLAYLQLILSIFFAPLIFITHKRVSNFIKLLKSLDTENLLIYQQYKNKTIRLFTKIPPYLFTQKAFIIPTLFAYKSVNYQAITAVNYKLLPFVGRNPTRHQLLISTPQKVHRLRFQQKNSAQFAMENLFYKNPNIVVSEG